jgi:hypothetical protein
MTRSTNQQPRPMAMVGAGPMSSAIWKLGDERSGWQYRFSLFRQTACTGNVSQLFSPSDLIHLVKLAHVLAAVLADDGCLPERQRGQLLRLAGDIDDMLRRFRGVQDRE